MSAPEDLAKRALSQHRAHLVLLVDVGNVLEPLEVFHVQRLLHGAAFGG